MRVVLDTNVLISAFIARGICSELLEHCSRQHRVVVSDFIIGEFRGRLVDKFKYTEQEAAEASDLIVSIAETVAPSNLATPVCRDGDDAAVLGTAVAGNAECIVTGKSRYRQISIATIATLEFSGSYDVAETAGA